jgi:hypothetical protein
MAAFFMHKRGKNNEAVVRKANFTIIFKKNENWLDSVVLE